MADQTSVRITEIFYSLQGETGFVGWPTVFVRLTGCPLRCHYCDTPYAFHGGERWLLQDILQRIQQYATHYVTVSGGEPLAQPSCLTLLSKLCDAGYTVSLETSGALDVSQVDSRVIKILDLKTPGSGEANRNRWQNLQYLMPHDQIKFVVCHNQDYQWVKSCIKDYHLDHYWQVLLSPSHEAMSSSELADWMLADQLNARFQLQMHKYIWGDVAGR